VRQGWRDASLCGNGCAAISRFGEHVDVGDMTVATCRLAPILSTYRRPLATVSLRML
jgi:hypothetical protein